MNEVSKQSFDYSVLSSGLKDKIEKHDQELNRIYNSYAVDVGRVLKQAQDDFSDYNNGGLFLKWYQSRGLKRQNVYNYIQIFTAFQNLEGDQRDLFVESPKSLQIELSKPSAKEEVNQAYYEGDIKTHKEYKQLEKKIKEKDQQIQALSQAVEDVEPQVIEREVVKKEVPADYERIKRENERFNQQLNQAQGRMNHLKQEIEQLKSEREEVDEKSRKYDELNEAIQKMQGQLDEGQQKIAAQKEVYELVEKTKELIKEVSPLTYLIDAENIIENDYARKPLVDIANKLHDIADNIERQINEPTIIQ